MKLKRIVILLLFFSFIFCNYTKADSIPVIEALSKTDTLLVKQFTINEKTESWKAWLPTSTALIVLLITNLVVLYKIKADTRQAIKKDVIISRVNLAREKLEMLYNPIFTILNINSEMFNSYGPNTFPKTVVTAEENALMTEALNTWNKIVEDVIIPNNEKICEIIYKYSHFLESEGADKYLDYVIHAKSYKHFIKYPNSLHKKFKYPSDFIVSVANKRQEIFSDLKIREQELIK